MLPIPVLQGTSHQAANEIAQSVTDRLRAGEDRETVIEEAKGELAALGVAREIWKTETLPADHPLFEQTRDYPEQVRRSWFGNDAIDAERSAAQEETRTRATKARNIQLTEEVARLQKENAHLRQILTSATKPKQKRRSDDQRRRREGAQDD
jgi:hypothetical protein